MEIKRIIITEVEGKRGENRSTKFSVNFAIGKAQKVDEHSVKVEYEYDVVYEDNGKIVIKGEVEFEDKDVAEAVGKGERISPEVAERLINSINYVGTVNAVLIARALNLVPPVLLPKLRRRQ